MHIIMDSELLNLDKIFTVLNVILGKQIMPCFSKIIIIFFSKIFLALGNSFHPGPLSCFFMN